MPADAPAIMRPAKKVAILDEAACNIAPTIPITPPTWIDLFRPTV